jgi:8-oxo-dGTP pyrophosphatase MutT (NUDIX family)
VAHYVVPVKPHPATPSPAATLVLLRDRPASGVEVLLIQRHEKSRFAGGAYVFPGGKIEADDNPADAARWCDGLDARAAARRLDLADAERMAVGYLVGAIRETFEEVGILLAHDEGGRPVRVDAPRFAEYRRACDADNRAFWEMVKRERLTLATDRLVYFAHWITPEESPYRYDTRFFAAEVPAGQDAVADEREIVDVRWLAAGEAIEAARRGEIALRTPTIMNLELLDGPPSVAAVLASLGGRAVPSIRPRVLDAHGERRVLMPGDPGYF